MSSELQNAERPTLKNDRFLRALRREPVDCTPVWIMRQAGRYLPEYRKTRAEAGSFLKLMKNPELACEVTLQPLRRFDLDASILFSDILTIPAAMGLGLQFVEGEGPMFEHPLRTRKQIYALRVPEPEAEMPYVYDTIRLLRQEIGGKVPLIGFAGSPWTLATYMIEGKGSREFLLTKKMLYTQPEWLHHILTVLAESVAVYLNAQIKAGAQALMIFDTWGGILSERAYHEFSLRYLKMVAEQLEQNGPEGHVPLIMFTKGGGQWLSAMADTGADALGLDWTANISKARAEVGDRVCLQGHLDPGALHGHPDYVRSEVSKILDEYGQHNADSGHVFNLGHGINKAVEPEQVGVLVDAVHELSRAYHPQ